MARRPHRPGGYKIIPVEDIVTDHEGKIVSFNTFTRTIPVPGNTPESYRAAIDYCRKTAAALNAKGSPVAAFWLAQADSFDREMAEKFGHDGSAPNAPLKAWSLGNGKYRVDGHEAIELTENEDNVLQALIEKGPLSLEKLRKDSGVPRAEAVLSRLGKKYEGRFKPFIKRPGGRDSGGYSTSISPIQQKD